MVNSYKQAGRILCTTAIFKHLFDLKKQEEIIEKEWKT